jgi:hypothetical protein
MITIFSDFANFRQKFGVFQQKKQSYDQILAKTCSSLSKNAKIFGEHILKIITSVPGME